MYCPALMIKAEKEMKIELVQSISTKYAELIMHEERFIRMWNSLERQVFGNANLRIADTIDKIRNLKFGNNMHSYLRTF